MKAAVLISFILCSFFAQAQNDSRIYSPETGEYVSDSLDIKCATTQGYTGKYYFEVTDDPSFVSVEVTDSSASGILKVALQNNTTYYCRGGKGPSIGNVSWGDVSSFNYLNINNYDSTLAWWDFHDSLLTQSNDTIYHVLNRATDPTFDLVAEPNYEPRIEQENGLQYAKFEEQEQFKFGEITLEDEHSITLLVRKHTDYSDIMFANQNGSNYLPWIQSSSTWWYRCGGSGNGNQGSLVHGEWTVITFERQGTSVDVYQDSLYLSTIVNASFGPMVIEYFGGRGDKTPQYLLAADVMEIVILEEALGQNGVVGVAKYLYDKYWPRVDLGEDHWKSSLCADTIVPVLTNYDSYVWSDGSTDTMLVVNSTGWYHVTTTDDVGRESFDSVYVNFPLPDIVNTDTMICNYDSVAWGSGLSHSLFSFNWSNGITDSAVVVSLPGEYNVTVTDLFGCSYVSDTLFLSVDSLQLLTDLGPDISVCEGNAIGLVNDNEVSSYVWSTGFATPSIVIIVDGTYSVTVTDSLGCVGADTIVVDIKGTAPVVGFEIGNVCIGDSVTIADTSYTIDGSNIISKAWTYGNATSSTGTSDTTYAYASPGNYSVNLTIMTDSGCGNSATSVVQIYNSPSADITIPDLTICEEMRATFHSSSTSIDGTVDSLWWDFADPLSVVDTSTADTIVYVYDSLGVWAIGLIVESSFGCRDTTSANITIMPKPEADFLIQNACEEFPTKFFDNSVGVITEWNWSFGNYSYADVPNPEMVYDTAGVYNVSVTIGNVYGCLDTTYQTVEVYHTPVAAFSTTDFCVGNDIQVFDSSSVDVDQISQWYWNVLNDPVESNDQNPLLSFDLTGQREMQLWVSTDNGCVDSVKKVITIHGVPEAGFDFTPKFGAPPLEVTFINESVNTSDYNWTFGDGDSLVDVSPIHTYMDTGVYEISLFGYSGFSCVDSVSAQIKIMSPVLDLAIDKGYRRFAKNELSLTAVIGNRGTRDVTSFNLVATLPDGGMLSENVSLTIPSGDQVTYDMSSRFVIPSGENPAFVCLSVANPEGETDDVPENDSQCMNESDFVVYQITPNPVSDFLNLNFVLPAQGDVQIFIIDGIGQITKELYNGSAAAGLNSFSYDLTGMDAEMYFLVFKYSDKTVTQKFMKE